MHKDPLARMATRIDVGGGPNELHAANVYAAGYPACQVNKKTRLSTLVSWQLVESRNGEKVLCV